MAHNGKVERDLMTQELGILSLIKLGVRVITASGDDLTDTSDPMKKAMRQIAGAFAELEKARLVAKLRGARERKKTASGKCEGRKSLAERLPELIEAARSLDDGRSLRKIAASLSDQGFATPSGQSAMLLSERMPFAAHLPRLQEARNSSSLRPGFDCEATLAASASRALRANPSYRRRCISLTST